MPNDRNNPITKFCLAMEELRRTDVGRVRTANEMADYFFPRGASGAEDRIFIHVPPATRGPIISGWGIRGPKSALRDTNDKVRQVVADAFASDDIDAAMFEKGLDAQVFIDWVPLQEWWTFWRTGKLTGFVLQRALAFARDLGLIDDRWFLLHVEGRGGKLKGTDTLCDTLSKDQVIAWIRAVHESGDGSPAGLVAALGWETILSKTSQEALLFSVDALAKKIGLVAAQAVQAGQDAPVETSTNDVNVVGAIADAAPANPRAGSGWLTGGAPSRKAPAQSGTMRTAEEAPFGVIEPISEETRDDTIPPAMPEERKLAR